MSYVFLFNFFSLPLIFTLVTASISLFSHRRYNIFMFLFQTKLVSFFLSLVLSLSLLSLSMQTMTTKVERKTRLCCCLIVPSKSPGGYAIYRPNAWVLEMQNFITAYVGTDNFLRTKIYWMHNRTSADGHLSTTTTALRRPLFFAFADKKSYMTLV